MKRFVLMVTVGIAVCALTGLVGCSDDDDEILNPTAADSAEVEMFFSEFDDMGEVNGDMLDLTLRLIDSIMTAGGAGKVGATADVHVTLTWHAASQYWYCTAVDSSDHGDEVFNYMDSIQFLHGETAVQFPVDSLLTEVRSDLRLDVTGEGIDTATAWQTVVITAESSGGDTLHVTGSGGLLAEISEMDIEGPDTTTCDISFDLGFTYTNLVFDMTQADEEGPGCPRAGALAATGSVDISCTGAHDGTVSGTWTVTETFDDGEVTIVIQHGGFEYRTTQSCD